LGQFHVTNRQGRNLAAKSALQRLVRDSGIYMSLVCHLLGHRRSRSRATFDEKRQQWVSDCRRCATILIREDDGRWNPAPPAPEKLIPIEQPTEAVEQRGSQSERQAEAPEVPTHHELEQCAP
jgi:hypothetical protein